MLLIHQDGHFLYKYFKHQHFVSFVFVSHIHFHLKRNSVSPLSSSRPVIAAPPREFFAFSDYYLHLSIGLFLSRIKQILLEEFEPCFAERMENGPKKNTLNYGAEMRSRTFNLRGVLGLGGSMCSTE